MSEAAEHTLRTTKLEALTQGCGEASEDEGVGVLKEGHPLNTRRHPPLQHAAAEQEGVHIAVARAALSPPCTGCPSRAQGAPRCRSGTPPGTKQVADEREAPLHAFLYTVGIAPYSFMLRQGALAMIM